MVRLPDQLPFDGYLLSGSVCDDCSHTLPFSRVKYCTASVSFPNAPGKSESTGLLTDALLWDISRRKELPWLTLWSCWQCESKNQKFQGGNTDPLPLWDLHKENGCSFVQSHGDCEIIFIIKQNRNQFFCPHFPLSVKAFYLPNAIVSTSRRLSSKSQQ